MLKKVLLKYLCIGLLCLKGFSPGPTHAQTAKTITYNLPTAGKVSMAIYDADGKLVRTLLAAQPRGAGENTETWNGLDDKGVAVPSPNTCTWKLLETQGLKSEYLMTFGTSLPQGKEEWEVGLGNHVGPRCVATDASGIYIGSGNAENIANGMKMTWDGKTRIWSAWQPVPFIGRFSFAIMDGWLYHLQQNAKVGAHEVDKPNKLYQRVGDPDPTKYSTGIGWDALWPGARRTGASAWVHSDAQSMDMAAYNSGSNPQLVISYKLHNAVQWRHPRTGAVLKTVSLPSPIGVAIDNQGNVLAISENRIVKVGKDNSITVVIGSNLESPYRIDVDRTNGDILVAEQGMSQRVKKFSANGTLLKTFGIRGGRKYGLYNPLNFKDVVDICPDNKGGFLVVENTAPRRVAHFGSAGNLIGEWYGGGYWVPSSSPDPEDPTTVWYTINGQEIMRLKVDMAKKTWRIHSVYSYLKAGDGKTITPPFALGMDVFGGGYYDWHVRKRNGVTYLVRRNELQIIRVDEKDWSLKPCVKAFFSNANTKQASLWTDANGDGLPQSGEYRRYSWGAFGYNRLSLTAPVDFDYYRYALDGKVYVHDVVGWNSAGSPIFRDLNAEKVYARLSGFEATAVYQNPPNFFAKESADGPLYVAVNANVTSWSNASYNQMHRVDKDGTTRWRVGKHVDKPRVPIPHPKPGTIYTFKNNVGVVNGVVVAADFVGGWDGHPSAITYAWDADGLCVGGLFESPNLSIAPLWQYCQSTDNGAGAMWVDPRTKDVYFYGPGENEIRIIKVTGWNNWVRLSGKVGEKAINVSVNSYAVNSGGGTVGSFVADNYVTGGVTSSTTASIDLTGVLSPAPAGVYQSERTGNFTYTFDNLKPNAEYTVRLHLAETQYGQSNQRRINVNVNGVRALTDLDIYATAKARNKAVVRELAATTTATGQIKVGFTSSIGVAKLCGIEIVPGSPVAPPKDPEPIDPTPEPEPEEPEPVDPKPTDPKPTDPEPEEPEPTDPEPEEPEPTDPEPEKPTDPEPEPEPEEPKPTSPSEPKPTTPTEPKPTTPTPPVTPAEPKPTTPVEPKPTTPTTPVPPAPVPTAPVPTTPTTPTPPPTPAPTNPPPAPPTAPAPVPPAPIGVVDPTPDDKKIKVFPNPAVDKVNVTFQSEKDQEVTVQLVDAQSNVIGVMTKPAGANTKLTFQVGHLPSGVYFLYIKMGEQTIVRKVLVTKNR